MIKKPSKTNLYISICSIFAFCIWTILVCFINVKAIGPKESVVGFSSLNRFFHEFFGVNMSLYLITDWLGLVPIFFCLCFALLGLFQWIKRKNILKVDFDILVLGGFYVVVITAYLIFESLALNYRPILIDGFLEASYPSSTTLLVLCVMGTSIIQFNYRVKNKSLKSFLVVAISLFIGFMVVGRLLSGVHWLTDIIGSILLSVGLVSSYKLFIDLKR